MALAMSFTSCVREDLDQCPPLRINIEVKDKNYFNVDQTVPDEKRDENQSFRSFVPSLSYRLSRLNDDGTQQVIVEEKGFGVEGDGLTYPVSFDPDMVRSKITAIRAEKSNMVVFCMDDGSEIVKRWTDRSRAESWTPEMKEKARQRALQARRKKK